MSSTAVTGNRPVGPLCDLGEREEKRCFMALPRTFHEDQIPQCSKFSYEQVACFLIPGIQTFGNSHHHTVGEGGTDILRICSVTYLFNNV